MSSNIINSIKEGSRKLREVVAVTHGPFGSAVYIYPENGRKPFLTKDGVTVARNFSCEDLKEEVAASIIKEASISSETKSGDGTTTTVILCDEIYKKMVPHIVSGANTYRLSEGMMRASELAQKIIKKHSLPISSEEDLSKVVSIASNGDSEISEAVVEAVVSAGADGAILVKDNLGSPKISVEVEEGFIYPGGYETPIFINEAHLGCVRLQNALVLVTDEKLVSVSEQLIPILNYASRKKSPLVIVSDGCEGQVLASLIAYNQKNSAPSQAIIPVKPYRFGREKSEIFMDLAAATGATCISAKVGLKIDAELLDLGMFGFCEEIEVGQFRTAFVGGRPDEEFLASRVQHLRREIKEEMSVEVCELLEERVQRLMANVSKIMVGALTRNEMVEKKFRINDAIGALRSAQENGVVSAAATSYLRASLELESHLSEFEGDVAIGARVMTQALVEPFISLMKTASLNPYLFFEAISKDSKASIDMFKGVVVGAKESGLLEPVDVICGSIASAASAANSLILIKDCLCEKR